MPDEVLLLIQSHLPLASLIVARGVCKFWRSLIPGSHITPARHRLLSLYLHAIDSPAFHATRRTVLSHLYDFNRHAWLARLHTAVPDEFRTWILEWPERAVIGSLWPALKTGRHAYSEPDLFGDRGGVLMPMQILSGLAFQAPAPGTIVPYMMWRDVEGDCGIALLLDDANVEGWQRSRMLVLNGSFEGKDMSGRVYQVDGVRGSLQKAFANSWVDFLHQELEREDVWLQERQRERHYV